jgi:hypothetical protein
VDVCKDCNEEPAVAKSGPERGYEIREGMSNAEMGARIRAYALEASPLEIHSGSMPQTWRSFRDRTHGWILVRVRIKDAMGRARDLGEAVKGILDKPWISEARYLGHDSTYYCFERPDPSVAAELRKPSENPLISLEKFRSA